MSHKKSIHSTAVIEQGATIGENVVIGPFCVVGKDVILHDNVELKSHVVVDGITEIGESTVIYPFASIGTAPQDLKYSGEKSKVIIGKKNIIREYVTIQPGTQSGGMKTVIGDNNLFMICVHIAHDCVVGNGCILANNATLAGHVVVGDGAVLGGLAAVRQFVRIGQGAMVGGLSPVAQDVLPFVTVSCEKAMIDGVNIVGMTRKGFDLEEIRVIQNIVESLFNGDGTMLERVQELREQYKSFDSASIMLDFIESQGKSLGYCIPRDIKSKNNQSIITD